MMKLFFVKAETANRAGDASTATEASRQAKRLNICGLIIGITSIIVSTVIFIVMKERMKSIYYSYKVS